MAVQVTSNTITFKLTMEDPSGEEKERALTFDLLETVDVEEAAPPIAALFANETYKKFIQPAGWRDDDEAEDVYETKSVTYYTTETTKTYY